MAKCRFKEWLYGPLNKWPKEPPKAKQKKKERLIYKAPPVKCECGVKSNYGLVPSELGIGHYCVHWLSMMRLVIFVVYKKLYFVSFAKTYMI